MDRPAVQDIRRYRPAVSRSPTGFMMLRRFRPVVRKQRWCAVRNAAFLIRRTHSRAASAWITRVMTAGGHPRQRSRFEDCSTGICGWWTRACPRNRLRHCGANPEISETALPSARRKRWHRENVDEMNCRFAVGVAQPNRKSAIEISGNPIAWPYAGRAGSGRERL